MEKKGCLESRNCGIYFRQNASPDAASLLINCEASRKKNPVMFSYLQVNIMCFLESMFLFLVLLKNVPKSYVEVCTIETKNANNKGHVAKIAPVLFH